MKKDSAPTGATVVLRFTGASGGTTYVYDGGRGRLRPGDTVRVIPKGHWLALLESGDAEIVR